MAAPSGRRGGLAAARRPDLKHGVMDSSSQNSTPVQAVQTTRHCTGVTVVIAADSDHAVR